MAPCGVGCSAVNRMRLYVNQIKLSRGIDMFELVVIVVLIVVFIKIFKPKSQKYGVTEEDVEIKRLRQERLQNIERSWWYGIVQLLGAAMLMFILVKILNP
jgi:hypothetical protein